MSAPVVDMAGGDPPAEIVGLATISRMVFDGGGELQPLWDQLVGGVDGGPGDAARLMDLSTILLATGSRDQGLEVQGQALALRRLYSPSTGRGGALKVLALVAPGDFMANTPLEFLLDGSDAQLTLLYVAADAPPPQSLPEHDVAFLAVGESAANLPLLRALEAQVAAWPRPMVNAAARRISQLTRDGVCALLDGAPGLVAPRAARLDRTGLERLASGVLPLEAVLPGSDFPILARPIGSHAGAGLAKLDDLGALAAYLEGRAEEGFYLSPFVDYSSPADGLFRKQRIALIEGRPFLCHHAISEHWMVHYLSAGMVENAGRREEEARMMASFDEDFALRHQAAFQAMAERIGLDYFAIDCAETRDGRLLLFEADVAMIVHNMDPPDLFPYKQPQMRKVFGAFTEMLKRRAGAG